MINPAQQLLLDLIRNHGVSILKNPKQFEAELKLSARGQYSREIALWIDAIQHGIVSLLLKNMDKPISMTAHHLVLKMHEDCGTDLQAANWTIESWMIALGLLSPGEMLPLQGTTLQAPPSPATGRVRGNLNGQAQWLAMTWVFTLMRIFSMLCNAFAG